MHPPHLQGLGHDTFPTTMLEAQAMRVLLPPAPSTQHTAFTATPEFLCQLPAALLRSALLKNANVEVVEGYP